MAKTRVTRVTRARVLKFIEIASQGLSYGMGVPTPGNMCVEAAVCYAFGLPHGDDPECVASSLRSVKIVLNDMGHWLDKKDRARGLIRLGVVQLGSVDNFDNERFARELIMVAHRKQIEIIESRPSEGKSLPTVLLWGFSEGGREKICSVTTFEELQERKDVLAYDSQLRIAIEQYGERNFRFAATSAVGYALRLIETSAWMHTLCEDIVQILVKMKVPGAKWLPLTEGN